MVKGNIPKKYSDKCPRYCFWFKKKTIQILWWPPPKLPPPINGLQRYPPPPIKIFGVAAKAPSPL